MGLEPEQRVLMVMTDSPDFVTLYLAAMRIGAIPVPVSTMLHADGIAELLQDSRARLLALSPEFEAAGTEAVVAVGERADLRRVLVGGAAVPELREREPGRRAVLRGVWL